MANTFITVDQIAVMALSFLKRKATLLNNVWRDVVDAGVAMNTGETVTVRTPPSFTANSYNGTTLTVQDITEGSVQMTLDKDFEVSGKWSQREEAASVTDLERLFVGPAMDALLRKVETDLESDFRLALISAGREFGNAIYGNVVTVEDITKARQALNENDVPFDDRWLNVSAKDAANLIQKTVFTDRSASGRDTLTDGQLGNVFNFMVEESNAIITNTSPSPDETYNLFYHRTAYTVGMRALPTPTTPGVEFSSATEDGLTVNVTKQWSFNPQSTVMVFRVIYGTQLLDAGRAGILKG